MNDLLGERNRLPDSRDALPRLGLSDFHPVASPIAPTVADPVADPVAPLLQEVVGFLRNKSLLTIISL